MWCFFTIFAFSFQLYPICLIQYKTLYKKTILTKNITVMVNGSGILINGSQIGNYSTVLQTIQETMEEIVPVSGSSNGVNALGLVVFSMFFGFVIGKMKQQGQPLKDFFVCLNDAIMQIVEIIMWWVPVNVLLLANSVWMRFVFLHLILADLVSYTGY